MVEAAAIAVERTSAEGMITVSESNQVPVTSTGPDNHMTNTANQTASAERRATITVAASILLPSRAAMKHQKFHDT